MIKLAKQSKNKTPRNYLSWSQMFLFLQSEEAYTDVYLRGLKSFENGAMKLGSRLADRLESDKPTKDRMLEHVATFLPHYQKREFEISVDFEGIPLHGKLDGFNPKPIKIGEYKTSKNKWTQKMVDKFGQLTFYNTLVWQKYKIPPKDIPMELTWVRTEIDKTGMLVLTDEIKTFTTKRTMSDIILFRAKIKKVWQGIQLLSREYAKGNL